MNNDNIMLKIKGLKVSVDDREILTGVNLEVRPGEVHAIMGPNGSGKHSFRSACGQGEYKVTEGEILYEGEDLLKLSPEERSWAGVFLGFQYPIEIPGVTNVNFIKTAVNEHRKRKGLPELSAAQFLKLMRERMAYVDMDSSFTSRGVNVGFSGGEKKRNEIFHMAMLEPSCNPTRQTPIDVDAPRVVAGGINRPRP